MDRLYDGESGAVDVETILRLAGMALSDQALGALMIEAADRLVEAMSSEPSGELSANDALGITDTIREPIADAWSDHDS